MKQYNYNISGLHCPSCKILIEDIMEEHTGIQGKVDIQKQTLSCMCHDQETADKHIEKISPLLKKHGYTISHKKIKEQHNENIGLPIMIGICALIIFFILQKSGVLNFSVDGAITPTTSFILGLIASVSSCLAVVGGLILGISAQLGAQGRGNKKPIILFHSARIISFAVLGGLLGIVGKAIGVNMVFSAILGVCASIIMILLGLNLLGILQNTFTLPANFFGFFRKKGGDILMPIFVGVGTFFLPCGFTQSMQIAALSSGSFINGGAIMLFFALGTFPMLALLSFGSVSFSQSRFAPLFFKSVGVVIIGLGILTLGTGLVGLGILPAFITF